MPCHTRRSRGGHRIGFGDPFAVSLLVDGVEFSVVSILLGDVSIKIAERHSPWIKAEPDQLDAHVRRM